MRQVPQSADAEQSVLGGLMLDARKWDTVAAILREEDFYRRDHRLIFRAIAGLANEGKAFDVVTLGEWFEGRGAAGEIGGADYLIELAQNTPSAANIKAYADIVREKALLRQVIEVATEAVDAGYQPDGRKGVEVLDEAIAKLMRLVSVNVNCEYTMRQAIKLAYDDVSEAFKNKGQLRGITTGYKRMDKRLGGWHPGDLVFIGARPSMGKTAMMVNFALAADRAGHGVGVISGEQSAMQIGQRVMSLDSKVPAEALRNGELDDPAWPKLTGAITRLSQSNALLYDRSAPTLDEIARVARRWVRDNAVKVLFVDYLQRIRVPKADNRIDEVAEVARGLKTLARDLDIPIVCLAQVKAEVDKRADKRPGLGDIANSDEATREADLIAFLYRGEVYDEGAQGSAELNVEKYRHGPTGQFKLHFSAATMTFYDTEPTDVWSNAA